MFFPQVEKRARYSETDNNKKPATYLVNMPGKFEISITKSL